ncbi:hypothetical protein [Lachnoclostridium phocaeense]|uniref:hypothetical protein n=1 Tax=Lachnoclostridium phocaeense TaxID=1871021 RepID=UPI00248E0AEF|nr:hypothetical protein [Lachnoclostridium phocaeense]
MDRFLFAEAMEDPVIMQTILEIILGKDILLKYPPQAEKEKRSSPLFRFIRMDVWAMDMEDTVYDAEVQKEDTKNLPRRSRLYQSMIAPFDLFGKDLYRYTFRMRCDEDPGIALDDGAARIFLNTRGKDPLGVSEELIELLRYIEHTTEEVSSSCRSGKIRELQCRIAMIKSSEEIGVKYMQEWEEKVIEQRRAREEGVAEGRVEGAEHKLFVQIYKKLSKGCSLSATADSLEEEIPDIQDMYDFLKPRKTQTVEESWKDWLASGGRQSLASPGSRVTTP